MRRVGILGGAFDPVHIGHLIVAQDVLSALSLDVVFFIPVYRPPHKPDHVPAPAQHRLKMVELAVEGNPGLASSGVEIERGDVSYTVDTLRELRRTELKDAEIYFILGSDNVPEIQTWKDPCELSELCSLVTIQRPGYANCDLPEELDDGSIIVGVTAVDISSRDIRERVKNGRSIKYLVPEKVEKYIYREQLYKSTESS